MQNPKRITECIVQTKKTKEVNQGPYLTTAVFRHKPWDVFLNQWLMNRHLKKKKKKKTAKLAIVCLNRARATIKKERRKEKKKLSL